MRHLLPLFALAAALPACAQKRLPPQAAPKRPRIVSTLPVNKAPSDTALVFQRTGCHGTCPIYTATVFRNGRVAYEGERFVPVLGSHTFTLPIADVTALLDEARRIGFADFKYQYTGQVMDLPSTIVTVYQPGQHAKQVVARQNYPESLRTYIEHLKSKFDPLAGLPPEK